MRRRQRSASLHKPSTSSSTGENFGLKKISRWNANPSPGRADSPAPETVEGNETLKNSSQNPVRGSHPVRQLELLSRALAHGPVGNCTRTIKKKDRPERLDIIVRRRPPEPSIVFDTYWRFTTERQEIFLRRLSGSPPPWSEDPILRYHKFTNVYRASDRVSQYLIRNVIYKGDQQPREVFFRTVLFKLFNKIETWRLLVDSFGWPVSSEYKTALYDRALTAALARGERIYSAAYIMPSALAFGGHHKHVNHLLLLDKMMRDGLPEKIAGATDLRSVFQLFRSYYSIGDFLAFQLTVDLNYSTVLNFSEMDFVVPGPGAMDGIRKCFVSLGDYNPTDVIRLVADTQDEQFNSRGIVFRSLWGRPLQLVDCQNVFCEVDKYARIAHPEFIGRTARRKIKQRYRQSAVAIEVWYPPKWGINRAVIRTEPPRSETDVIANAPLTQP